MTMQRWDPFGEMMSLRTMMDRLFDDAFVRAPVGASGQQTGGMAMPLDLYEKDDAVVVRASLPGISPDDITITVQGNTVSIEGELKPQHEQHGQLRHQEHRYGRFFRSVTLPSRVNSDNANAEFEHGVLTLTLPKEEAARSRQIPIRGASQPKTIDAQSQPAQQIEASSQSTEAEKKRSANGHAQAAKA